MKLNIMLRTGAILLLLAGGGAIRAAGDPNEGDDDPYLRLALKWIEEVSEEDAGW